MKAIMEHLAHHCLNGLRTAEWATADTAAEAFPTSNNRAANVPQSRSGLFAHHQRAECALDVGEVNGLAIALQAGNE